MSAALCDVREVPFCPQGGVPIHTENMHAYEAEYAGYHRTFKMYIPAACRKEKGPFALIVVNHGGESHNIYTYTVWHLLAEREKLIIAYPECWYENTPWNIWALMSDVCEYPDDVTYIDAVIDYAMKTCPIDKTRIHMTGHSMGDAMTTYYAVVHPHRLASAAGTQGPSKSMWMMNPNGSLRAKPQGAIAFVRTHGEEDCFFAKALTDEERKWYKQQCHIIPNNNLWLTANYSREMPQIRTELQKNELIYSGTAECRFITYSRGLHRPPIDYAEDLWERIFSRYRRVGETLLVEGDAPPADRKAIAACESSVNSYYDNQLCKAKDEMLPSCIKNELLYVDMGFFEGWFQGTKTEWQEGQETVRILTPECEAKIYLPTTMKKSASDSRLLAAGSRQCPTKLPGSSISVMQMNGKLDAIPGIQMEGGRVMVPFSAVMQKVYGYFTDEAYGVGYAADHEFRLTYDLCFAIKRILEVEHDLLPQEIYEAEQKIYCMERADLGMVIPKTEEELVLQWIRV